MKKIGVLVLSSCLLFVTFAEGIMPFDINLRRGNIHNDVLLLQQYLNNHGFPLAQSGPGSPGNETNYFWPRTQRALRAFQEYYGVQILSPLNLLFGTGNFFSFTRNYINNQLLTVKPDTPGQNKDQTTPVIHTVTNTVDTNIGTTPPIAWVYVGGGGGGGRSITPTILFNDITMSYTTTPFQITATSDSSWDFVYESSNPTIASVIGDIVTVHDIGSITLTATQSASGRYISISDTATLTITDIDGCEDSPCENGGTCTHVAPGGYSCDCAFGYSWETCGTFDGYSVWGMATGITDTVVLQNNGGNNMSLSWNGAFTFSSLLANLATYIVTIETEPESLVCSLSNATWTISGSNITNIWLACLARPAMSNFPNIINNAATGIPTYTLTTPTSNSIWGITYSIGNNGIWSISGNLLTIHGTGTTTLTATQAANGIYGIGTIQATLTINVVDACVSSPCLNGTCNRTRSVPD